MSFGDQAGVCEGFRHTPVNRLTARSHAFARFEHAFGSRMQCKAFGDGGKFLGKTLDIGSGQTGFHIFAPVFTLVFAPVNLRALEIAQRCLLDVFAFIQSVAVGLDIAVGFRLRYHAFCNQLLGVQSTRTGVLRYFFVHHRLGQGRIVALVVTPFAVADDIDHDVFVEFLTVVQSGLDGEANAFRIVAVDVDDRSGNHFRHVGTMHGRTGVAGIGSGEADLVVDDDVNRTAGGVAARFGQVERCLVDAQADKCRVAVNQYGQYFVATVFAQTFLFGACRTFNDRIHDFQVRRVERQRNVHRTVRRSDVGAETHVVFHVAAGQLDFGTAFKFGKQIARFLAQNVDQDIQTTSVCHTNDDFFDTVFTCVLNQVIQTGNHALAAFYAEAFLTDIFGMQITLQSLGSGHFFQDAAFLFGTVARGGQHILEIIAQPAALFGIGNVDVFQCEVAAVGLLEVADDLGQGQFALAGKIALAHIELNRHIGIIQSVEFGIEGFNVAWRDTFERVKLSGAHTLNTVSRNQPQYADLFLHHGFIHTAGNSRCRFGFCQIGEGFTDRRMGDINIRRTGLLA